MRRLEPECHRGRRRRPARGARLAGRLRRAALDAHRQSSSASPFVPSGTGTISPSAGLVNADAGLVGHGELALGHARLRQHLRLRLRRRRLQRLHDRPRRHRSRHLERHTQAARSPTPRSARSRSARSTRRGPRSSRQLTARSSRCRSPRASPSTSTSSRSSGQTLGTIAAGLVSIGQGPDEPRRVGGLRRLGQTATASASSAATSASFVPGFRDGRRRVAAGRPAPLRRRPTSRSLPSTTPHAVLVTPATGSVIDAPTASFAVVVDFVPADGATLGTRRTRS